VTKGHLGASLSLRSMVRGSRRVLLGLGSRSQLEVTWDVTREAQCSIWLYSRFFLSALRYLR
jgi:hypothetical protein